MPRHAPHAVVLADGRRVTFSVKQRPERPGEKYTDPYFFCYFRGCDGRRLERSTKALTIKNAVDATHVLIRDEYSPKAEPTRIVPWGEVLPVLEARMKSLNLRAATVADYMSTIATF